MEARIAQIIVGLAEYYGLTISKNQIAMYVQDLISVNPIDLEKAVYLYRNDSKNEKFPIPAKLKAIIQNFDGRPGAEEAWSMAPKNEESAGYINDEIMIAWKAASDLLRHEDNMIAARMIFKEVYEKTVKDNRTKGIPPKWWLSRASGRGSEVINQAAMRDAVERGRLTIQKAVALLPNFITTETEIKQLTQSVDVKKLISNTFNKGESV